MTSESSNVDPYDLVLADLRAKRDQLDQTIKLLESQRLGASMLPASTQSVPLLNAGAFLGMTIADAQDGVRVFRMPS